MCGAAFSAIYVYSVLTGGSKPKPKTSLQQNASLDPLLNEKMYHTQ